MPHSRLGTTAVSDLVRVNRVQGLAFGLGGGLRLNGGYELRGTLGYGLSDRRVTAALATTVTRGATEWTADARRAIRDFGDEPVVSGVANSLLAQEAGKDLGDYILAEEIGVGLRRRLDPRWTLELDARGERSSSVVTGASPVRNAYQPNPELGSGSYWLGRTVVSLAPRGALDRADLKLRLALEGGVAAIGLGQFASTGKRAIIAPFVGVGWAGGTMPGLTWVASDGARPVVGIAGEFLQGLVRIEAGKRLRGRGPILITADIASEWWPIL